MSDANEQSFGQLTTMQEGEFAGWQYWLGDPYETRSGPFFQQLPAIGQIETPQCRFGAEIDC